MSPAEVAARILEGSEQCQDELSDQLSSWAELFRLAGRAQEAASRGDVDAAKRYLAEGSRVESQVCEYEDHMGHLHHTIDAITPGGES